MSEIANKSNEQKVADVEDEMPACMMIEDMLGRPRMRVFDAAMLDVNLNGNDNHPVAEAIVALGVPFVCSTGNSGYDIGCATPKPFKYEALVEILTRLLSR